MLLKPFLIISTMEFCINLKLIGQREADDLWLAFSVRMYVSTSYDMGNLCLSLNQ